MFVNLSQLKSNPMRDFSIDPIDEEAVNKLRQSIKDDGFWGGVVCRRQNGYLEIAAGHHRVKAALAEGISNADVYVGDYNDEKMIRVYARENATQRGNSGTAITGSIAAAIKFLLKGRDFTTLKNGSDSEIGAPQVVRFLDKVPGITDNIVKQQIAILKASGDYTKIVDEIAAERPSDTDFEKVKKRADEIPQTLNKKVVNTFKVPNHVETFHRIAKRQIDKGLPIEKQPELAEHLVNLAEKRNVELTSKFIKENAESLIRENKQLQRAIDSTERIRMEWNEKEKILQTGVAKSASTLLKLVAELADHHKQRPTTGPILMPSMELRTAYNDLERALAQLRKEL